MIGSRIAAATTAAVLNFAVVGGHRAGVSILQSSLTETPGVVCHGDLLFSEHGTPAEQDAVRRAAHESYYGPSRDPVRLPEWLHAEANPYRYLIDNVFDNPRSGETKIGVKMLYDTMQKHELYELLEERWREGDFCVVHVLRNPVACLVSLRQAQESGIWREWAGCPSQSYPPMPVNLDPAELAEHVRRYEAIRRKVRASCQDAMEVQYKDLVFRFDATVADVMEFLELPQQKVPKAATHRLMNRDMRRRIRDFDGLRKRVSSDVARYLDEDLF